VIKTLITVLLNTTLTITNMVSTVKEIEAQPKVKCIVIPATSALNNPMSQEVMSKQ